jgi:hypothetical protein
MVYNKEDPLKTLFYHNLKTKIKYFFSTHEENFYIILSKHFQHDELKNISSLINRKTGQHFFIPGDNSNVY